MDVFYQVCSAVVSVSEHRDGFFWGTTWHIINTALKDQLWKHCIFPAICHIPFFISMIISIPNQASSNDSEPQNAAEPQNSMDTASSRFYSCCLFYCLNDVNGCHRRCPVVMEIRSGCPVNPWLGSAWMSCSPNESPLTQCLCSL